MKKKKTGFSRTMNRVLKRILNKYFGGLRVFLIWLVCLSVTIYLIETYYFGSKEKERLPSSVPVADTVVVQGDSADETNEGLHGLPRRMKEEALANPEDKKRGHPREIKHPQIVDTGYKCNLNRVCPHGKYPYAVTSGIGIDFGPIICFNGKYYVSHEKKNWERGLNMVIVDDVTKKVTEIKHFDTYLDDASMVRYLKLVIPDNHIILVGSSDEMTYNLHEDAKGWLMKYGSQAVTGAKFRDNFVMIGQRGLTAGAAVEQLVHRNAEEEFAQVAEVKGCLSVPMGPLTKIEISKPQIGDKSSMEPGWELPNCGLEHPCGPNTFPAHIYTAKGRTNIKNKGPKICVNGQYVLSAGVNDAGRGFNIAIVDPIEIEVVRVGHFDTYAEDSSHLEIFLEMIKEGEIILAVTHDDASRNVVWNMTHVV